MRSVSFSNASEMRISFWVKTKTSSVAPIYLNGVRPYPTQTLGMSVDLRSIPSKKLDVKTIVNLCQSTVNMHMVPGDQFQIKKNIYQIQVCDGSKTTYDPETESYKFEPLMTTGTRIEVIFLLDSLKSAERLQNLTTRQSGLATVNVPYRNGNRTGGGSLSSSLNYTSGTKLLVPPDTEGFKKSSTLQDIGRKLKQGLETPGVLKNTIGELSSLLTAPPATS